MKLTHFQIHNYRSINDSGWIEVGALTALLGRNESGKSNLLRALHSLNPIDGLEPLNKSKDFPRHRRLEECSDNTLVVATLWELSDSDRQAIASLWPRGGTAKAVSISRHYAATRAIGFRGVANQEFDPKAILAKARKIVPAIKARATKLDADARQELESAANAFEAAIKPGADAIAWATKA